MKRRVLQFILALFLTAPLFSGIAMAQSPQIKKDLKKTKNSVDKLIQAKDENSSLSLGLRIKTLKNVIELSKSEAKNLKISLLALNLKNKKIIKWRNDTISKLEEAIEYFNKKKKFIDKKENQLDLGEVKGLAKEIKKWRQDYYDDLRREVQNLLMIKQEEKIVKTAQKRWSKVKQDVKLLERAGYDSPKLNKFLKKSKKFINKGVEQKKKAMELFLEKIEEKTSTSTPSHRSTSTTSSTKPSTEEKATTTRSVKVPTTTNSSNTTTSKMTSDSNQGSSTLPQKTNDSLDTSTSSPSIKNTTTSEDFSTSTQKSKTHSTSSKSAPKTASTTSNNMKMESRSNKSVKTLVESSLKNIKDGYQVFIEMSNFVRELLKN
ncbi:MAG: hypothetical protein ABEI53_02185 [Candidatus Magasanikbacteria bacterium]